MWKYHEKDGWTHFKMKFSWVLLAKIVKLLVSTCKTASGCYLLAFVVFLFSKIFLLGHYIASTPNFFSYRACYTIRRDSQKQQQTFVHILFTWFIINNSVYTQVLIACVSYKHNILQIKIEILLNWAFTSLTNQWTYNNRFPDNSQTWHC